MSRSPTPEDDELKYPSDDNAAPPKTKSKSKAPPKAAPKRSTKKDKGKGKAEDFVAADNDDTSGLPIMDFQTVLLQPVGEPAHVRTSTFFSYKVLPSTEFFLHLASKLRS